MRSVKTVSIIALLHAPQLRRNEGARRNEVEVNENHLTFQNTSEMQRSEAERLSEALLLGERFGEGGMKRSRLSVSYQQVVAARVKKDNKISRAGA